MNRRYFLKTSIFSLSMAGIFAKTMGLFNLSFAAACKTPDEKITKQKYISNVFTATPKQLKPLKKYKKEGDFITACINCKHYKKPKDGYGKCAMVGAKGKPCSRVSEAGMCKVYMLNKKTKNEKFMKDWSKA